MLRNTQDRYGSVSRSLHWGIAALIAATWGLGLLMEEAGHGTMLRDLLVTTHKSLGLTILVLVGARIGWALANHKPRALGVAGWQTHLAKWMHRALYAIMLAFPLSGYLGAASGKHPIIYFGLFTVPRLEQIDWLHKAAEGVHEALVWPLLILVAAHAVAALKHHWLDHDHTLLRMLRG